jgi:hypothetical protein
MTIAGGGSHTVALNLDGTVFDWGRNFFGQLGDGTTTNSSIPVQVSGLNLLTEPAPTVTLTAGAGSHGSISPSGSVVVESGTDITFTMTPAVGYEVASVLVDGFSVGTVSSYTFTSVMGPHTISVAFTALPPTYVTIAAVTGANGSISPLGSVDVLVGTDKTFTITPDSSYEVSDVLVDGSSVGAVSSYTFTNVVAPHTIFAVFAEIIQTCGSDPVLLGMVEPYPFIQDAYDGITLGSADTINIRELVFTESLLIDRNVTVTLIGGYDCYFSELPSGYAIISSPGAAAMIVSDGMVIVDGIILR